MPDRLSRRQREALEARSPKPNDILENMDYVKELNEEIVGSWDQKEARRKAAADPSLKGATSFDFEGKEEKKMPRPFKTDENSRPVPAKPEMVEDPLDLELARVNEVLEREQRARAATEKQPAEPVVMKSQEEIIREQIMELLSKSNGAPNEAQIAALKRQYGDNGVHVVALGEGDVYIFTHLRRGQWKKIQEVVAKMAQTEAFGGKADDALKEKVIQRCVLWPQGIDGETFLYNSRAGVIDTLFELIMLHSYFLTPQQAMQLTISL